MKASWTKGLDEQLTLDVTGNYLASLVTRKRLKTLLEEKIAEAERSSLSREKYEISNWALLQADLIGYKRALNDVISLIL